MYYVMAVSLHRSHTKAALSEQVQYYVTAAALLQKHLGSGQNVSQQIYCNNKYAHALLRATKNAHAKNQAASAGGCRDMARTKVCNILTDACM